MLESQPRFPISRAALFAGANGASLQAGHAGPIVKGMKTVAIIGASNDRNKFGNKAVRAFKAQGYTVYPVNPHETSVEGLTAYKSVLDVPVRPEMVSVYVQPQVLLKLLPEIAAKGCDELWLNPGTESDASLAEAERLRLNVIQACSIVGVGMSPAAL
jgi:predicted CoA-binding protein